MIEELSKEYDIHVNSQKQACLDEWVAHYRSYATEGQTANYIPALSNIHLSQLGICILEPGGTMMKSGDCEVPFTLQSISKVLSFIAACLGCGISLCFREGRCGTNWGCFQFNYSFRNA